MPLQLASKRPQTGLLRDPCTNSNYYDFNVIQTQLNLNVSFETKLLSGTVTYSLSFANHLVSQLTLDTSYLTIKSVTVNEQPLSYTLHPRFEPYGSPLEINLGQVDKKFQVSIDFSTTDKCTALQFIKGDTGPYLFSQCQSIHARSFFPCFDTPGMKSSYAFEISSPLKVLMTGLPESCDEVNVYKFKQPIPIPSYLVAIASGKILSAPIGPRSDVYCEEPKIDQCQWEFEQDMELFIEVAEKLTFKYEWSKFDVLVLPLSFPYGGMENPNITFATPSLLCKDRSQVKVLAHELAHSWAGNLVTNCSWEHFWLNEGWTVYLERRILGAVAAVKAKQQGAEDYELQGEKVRHFSAFLGIGEFCQSFSDLPQEATSLVWDLKGQDPDEFYSRVPYEKGFLFLYHIEQTVGIKAFDEFIPFYFKRFRYKSIDSFQFIDLLYEFFDAKVLDTIDFDKWLFGTGLPEIPKFDTSLVDECTTLADKWVESFKMGDESQLKSQFSEKDLVKFNGNQHLVFLNDLAEKLEGLDVDAKLVRLVAEIYPFYSRSENFEIIFSFSKLLITFGKFDESDTVVQRFASWLHTVGRMKYVRPGYKLLSKYISKEFAIKTFESTDIYHPICKSLVRKDLGI